MFININYAMLIDNHEYKIKLELFIFIRSGFDISFQ